MKKTVRFILAACLAAVSMYAGDLTITSTSKGKAMGMSSNGVETQYYTAKFHRTNNPATKVDTLVDYTKMATYTIDHGRKTVGMITLDDAIALTESVNQAMPEGLGGMLGSFLGGGGKAAEAKVEELGTEQVAGRTCTRYKITVGKLLMELSADPTLKPPVPAASYAKMIKARAALAAANPLGGGSQKKLYEEMSKIQGLALKSHMAGMMGVDVTTEATEVKEGPVPDSAFVIPANYKFEDLGKKLRKDLKHD